MILRVLQGYFADSEIKWFEIFAIWFKIWKEEENSIQLSPNNAPKPSKIDLELIFQIQPIILEMWLDLYGDFFNNWLLFKFETRLQISQTIWSKLPSKGGLPDSAKLYPCKAP